MTDYRAFIKAKLAGLDEERERLLTAIGLLDEAESESIREKISPKKTTTTNGVTLADTLVRILGEREMTTNEIYGHVVLTHETSRHTMAASLYRLQKRGKIVGKGGLWKLLGSTDSTEPPPQP